MARNAVPQEAAITSHIPRETVRSTALASTGYSKRRRILEIQSSNGVVYRYLDVPPSVYRDLMSAESKTRVLRFEHQTKLSLRSCPTASERRVSALKRRSLLLLKSLGERLVLKPEEKRVLCFVLAAPVLGVTVKHYWETQPEPSVSTKAPNRATDSPSPLQRKAEKKATKENSGRSAG